ncbi:uncharacterized protein LOC126905516 isoform X2 [Daktulosphaira vitifoliae]|uniref:uncharacterized protein LOC126905516 isoform X2 n=1 Tax=Daktulosphaira vitifoliae TaxID=58002 RepID=UPI0021AABBF3|nr:uncharacterized protein LOC126905516 isoform X2 [Daktulosphaira vitifoliae]
MIYTIIYIYVLISMMTLILSDQKLPFIMPKINPIKHEMRIMSANYTYNKNTIKTFSFDYHQYNNGVQYMDIYGQILNGVIIEITKCKENFIDCANLRTIELNNICDKIEAILFFVKIDYLSQDVKCPFQGEYIVKNMSIASHVYSMFFAPTERWWEYSFKVKLWTYEKNKVEFIMAQASAYFLTFRSRKN